MPQRILEGGKPEPQTEAEFQAAVIDAAHAFGWRVAHFRPAQRRNGTWYTAVQGDPGFVDLVMARHKKDGTRQVLFLELKSEHGRVREGQEAWLEVLGPCVSGVFRPSDWSRIEALLR